MLESQAVEAAQCTESAIRLLAQQSLPHASLVLFGLRARGDPRRRSDFDLAVLPRAGFSETEILNFSESLERSPEIIYAIDLIDFRSASAELRSKIESEGKLWKK